MVAAKNRMFRTATGRIITVQDAAKAGLIDPNDIPKDKEAAIAFRDKLVEQMSDKDREKLLDAAGDRVGYKINRDIKQEIKSQSRISEPQNTGDPYKSASTSSYQNKVTFRGNPAKDGFRPATFNVNVFERVSAASQEMKSYSQERKGFVRGDFALHKENDRTLITHLPSGHIVGLVSNGMVLREKEQSVLAKKMIDRLNRVDLSPIKKESVDVSGLSATTRDELNSIMRMRL